MENKGATVKTTLTLTLADIFYVCGIILAIYCVVDLVDRFVPVRATSLVKRVEKIETRLGIVKE